MAYLFTDHARRRMHQRGITEDQIKETVETPQIKYPDWIKGRWVHVRTYEQRLLKIVWIPENHDAYIVTAVWLEAGGRP